jgi:hypothetical protein
MRVAPRSVPRRAHALVYHYRLLRRRGVGRFESMCLAWELTAAMIPPGVLL